jgi:hypothetical protein
MRPLFFRAEYATMALDEQRRAPTPQLRSRGVLLPEMAASDGCVFKPTLVAARPICYCCPVSCVRSSAVIGLNSPSRFI